VTSPDRTSGVRGKVLLVTGTTGIAAATARLAADEGAQVCTVGIDRESGEALAASFAGCRFVPADLTHATQVAAAIHACVASFGRIDALFNVVGISGRRFGDGPLHECTEEGWDATFATNAKSMFLVSRDVVRRMLDQEPGSDGSRGVILNMGSVLASHPESRFFSTHAYAASKGAVLSLTRAMASYYAPHGIRVNAIAPSLVRTPMSTRAQESAEIVAFVGSKQPLAGGMLEADDVARAALFLLGAGSALVTGQVLGVDAGWSVSG
jgi:NAD(P)-dependent dehydrogenase (short-subunit alcohol dehydrogenase family)